MPKNEQGQIVCVNHPESPLEEPTMVGMRKLVDFGDQLAFVDNAFPANLLYCKQCGYIEFYTVIQNDDVNEQNQKD